MQILLLVPILEESKATFRQLHSLNMEASIATQLRPAWCCLIAMIASNPHPDKQDLVCVMLVLQESSGTVLVFLGNESPLDVPQQPIIFENADKHNALVILVEHR